MDTNMDEYEYESGHSSSGSSAPASSQLSLLQFALFVFFLTLLILFLFLQRHPTFRFFAKALSYYVWVSILSVAMLPVCALRGPTLENMRFVRSVVSHLQWLYGVEVKVEGREYLLNPEPCVIVANHQSALDFIGLMEVIPPHCAPVAKRQLAWAGPFGLMAILCKVVFIDRAHAQAAKLKLAQLAIQMHKEKLKIWIYPEGTRHGGRSMLDFKRGAFHLAVQAQVPIIPIIFSSYREFYCVSERRFHQGTVRVKILPPWETLGKEAEDVPHLTDSIREAMVETFQGLSGLTMKEETLPEGLRQRQTERITE